MPVRIGNSYVSEAAADFARKSNSKNLDDVSKKFPELKFSVGTQPFNANGTNNVSIATNILREMQNDPDKKIEYEALLYDIQNETEKRQNRKDVIASGFIINRDGSLGAWSISKRDDGKIFRDKVNLARDEFEKMIGKKSKKSLIQELLDKKSTEKKSDAESTDSTPEGKTTVNFNESKRARQLSAAKNLNDMNSLMQLLLEDLDECENGLENGWCDENEVKKVKKMIERAKQKLAEVQSQDSKKSAEENSDFSISILF